ncbi:MAG: Maf family nucleotide pyrophosphatase [Bacteroidota bacterium]
MIREHLGTTSLILASGSPRRQALLKGLDVDFTIRVPNVDETFPDSLQREAIPRHLCTLKSDACLEWLAPNMLVITADTVVWLNDQVLNKPVDRAEAKRMLGQLSNQQHTVITAVCLRSVEKSQVFHSETTVQFRALNAREIDYYLDRYQPYDKAGSYGIQEWLGYVAIERIEGCYFNVMGLPLSQLYKEMLEF